MVTLKGNSGIYEGESTDVKPSDVPVNTEFHELDTDKKYYYDGTNWNEEPSSGGSSFEPTEEQLAAMNSGITAADVQQIDTNKTNILSLIDTGAKNLVDVGTVVIETAGFVLPTNTPFVHGAGSYIISFSATQTVPIGANIVFDDDNSEILRQPITINMGNNVQTFTLSSAATKVRWYITGATTISNLMICTATAYSTSSAYEPYCPTLAEVYAMVKAMQT